MSELTRLCVRAIDLRVGDRCRGSGAIVVRAPTQGIRTLPGHVDLSVRYPDRMHPDATWRRSWRRDTMIAIEREETH